jgi:hypothetical protein
VKPGAFAKRLLRQPGVLALAAEVPGEIVLRCQRHMVALLGQNLYIQSRKSLS